MERSKNSFFIKNTSILNDIEKNLALFHEGIQLIKNNPYIEAYKRHFEELYTEIRRQLNWPYVGKGKRMILADKLISIINKVLNLDSPIIDKLSPIFF